MKKLLLNKKIIICTIIIIIIGVIYFLNSLQLGSYLRKKGFIAYDETTYYRKQNEVTKEEYEDSIKKGVKSTYDYLYFNLGINNMSEEIGIYDDEVKLEYIGEYNYKSKVIIYSIRGEYLSTVIQFTGKADYNNNRFSCSPILHHDITYDSEVRSSVCTKAKEYSQQLHNNSLSIIDNDLVLKKIIKNSEE